MIITSDDLSGIQELKDFFSQQFEMKELGHLNYFLGLEITHSINGIYITQAKYTSELLFRAELTDSKTVDTPIELNAHLTPSRGKPLSNPFSLQTLVDIGWTKPVDAKSTWDKATLAAANANSKVLNAIFCGISPEEFHRISHITVAKEAWEILEMTYEGTKKVKDTKLQMLTTRFEQLKMDEDESFDTFYSKLNEVVIGKFNLGEKTEESKVVRKILRSLPESFRAKVIAIEESKDLDEIKVQELVGSLQTYELSLPSAKESKSFAFKTIDERIGSQESSEEDTVDNDVAECPNYLKSKGKVYATTLSDSDSSNSDSDESCDGEGNFSAFMTIAHVESSDGLDTLVKELGEHSDLESIGVVEESEAEEDEGTLSIQENYTLLLERSGEYARIAKTAGKKMKRAEEDYKSLLSRYKEAKCEIETLNGELSEAYTKVRFLEQEMVQAQAKIERVSSRKLEDVISSQKHFSDKSGVGYTGGSSSSAKAIKEVKFVKAKEPTVEETIPKNVEAKKK
ncbi:uncharacterized protein LOC136069720 [Quercus suber]|uniref:uncharacterized protein LOC136069720 n=1 Tax=Quercus suber TaxID=58331 RepID=UPI0032DFCC31